MSPREVVTAAITPEMHRAIYQGYHRLPADDKELIAAIRDVDIIEEEIALSRAQIQKMKRMLLSMTIFFGGRIPFGQGCVPLLGECSGVGLLESFGGVCGDVVDSVQDLVQGHHLSPAVRLGVPVAVDFFFAAVFVFAHGRGLFAGHSTATLSPPPLSRL